MENKLIVKLAREELRRSFAWAVATLLNGLGKSGIEIEDQVDVLRMIANDLEDAWKEELKKNGK